MAARAARAPGRSRGSDSSSSGGQCGFTHTAPFNGGTSTSAAGSSPRRERRRTGWRRRQRWRNGRRNGAGQATPIRAAAMARRRQCPPAVATAATEPDALLVESGGGDVGSPADCRRSQRAVSVRGTLPGGKAGTRQCQRARRAVEGRRWQFRLRRLAKQRRFAASRRQGAVDDSGGTVQRQRWFAVGPVAANGISLANPGNLIYKCRPREHSGRQYQPAHVPEPRALTSTATAGHCARRREA